MKLDFGIDIHLNQSKGEIEFGESTIKVFTLNKEHMKQKEVPTGISIKYTKKAVINLVDECSPDIDYQLWSVFEQSQKSGDDQIPKVTIFMSNPWVRGDYFVSKWFKALQWTRIDGMNPPYYKVFTYKKTTYIGASLFANPMCPSTDVQTYLDTTSYNQNQRDIVIFGIPGASNGQVFDNFYKMEWKPLEHWTCYYGGIDIGWTTIAGDGGATTCELFKFDGNNGIEGCMEYYHHNKDAFIDSAKQQTYILDKICNFLSTQHNSLPCIIKIDSGSDSSIATHFANEWNQKFAHRVQNKVIFLPISASMKQHWRLKDRYDWINQALAMSKVMVNPRTQPHLYSDLEGAVYDDVKVNIEKDPTMMHQFSDTIMALAYAVFEAHQSWLAGWKLFEKKKQQLAKNHTGNTNSTSPVMPPSQMP